LDPLTTKVYVVANDMKLSQRCPICLAVVIVIVYKQHTNERTHFH